MNSKWVSLVLSKLWKYDVYSVFEYPLEEIKENQGSEKGVVIKIANHQDIDFLVKNWPASLKYLGQNESEIKPLITSRLNHGDLCFFATIKSNYVASSWVSESDMHLVLLNEGKEQNKKCWKNVFIVPEYRRSGLAIMLYNKVIEFVKKQKGSRLYGFVQSGNEKSINMVTNKFNADQLGKLVFCFLLNFKIVYFIDNKGRKVKKRYPKKGEFVF